MKIHRLYADKNGESHFETVEIPLTEASRAGRLSARMPATGIIFREVLPDYDLDWHPAPRRQYIVNLDAGVQITASDGESRKIGAGEIRKAGGQAHAVAANIADPAECEKLVEAARTTYGPVDVLVNNAALTYFLPIREYPVNKWLASWSVNVHAPFVLSQLVLPDMIPRRQGAIVNISSGAAIGPGRGPYADPAGGARNSTCYGAEKAALERFTQGLAAEVYQHGVSVTCVSPSQIVPTPGTIFHKLIKDV